MKDFRMSTRGLKFCANLAMMFPENPELLGRIDAAKSAGFKAIEIGFPYDIPVELIRKKLDETGLELILLNSFSGDVNKGERGFAALPQKQAEFMESMKLSLLYASTLKSKRIHFLSGKSQGLENTPEILQILEENLRLALPELEKHDIIGLIEPINNYSVPGYVLSDFDAALSVVKKINSPHVRLQLDLFHLQQIHGNLTRRITEALPFTAGHIQIAQVPNRHEPTTAGEISYDYIFSLLEELNYKGWIGLEYIPEKGTEAGLVNWLDKLRCCL